MYVDSRFEYDLQYSMMNFHALFEINCCMLTCGGIIHYVNLLYSFVDIFSFRYWFSKILDALERSFQYLEFGISCKIFWIVVNLWGQILLQIFVALFFF